MPPPTFSIRLLPPRTRDPDGHRLAEIRIGPFTERFSVYPLTPSADANALEAIWLRELTALTTGAPAIALPTAPNMTWLLYRFGDEVRIHQHLIPPGHNLRIHRDLTVTNIPAYQPTTDEGEPISEWTTTIQSIRAFLSSGKQ